MKGTGLTHLILAGRLRSDLLFSGNYYICVSSLLTALLSVHPCCLSCQIFLCLSKEPWTWANVLACPDQFWNVSAQAV